MAQGQTISWPRATLVAAESAGSATGTLQGVLQAFGTATAGQDFTYASTQTVTFPAGATGSQTLTIPLLDDAAAEETEYETRELAAGIYVLRAPAGATSKLVVR